MEENHILVDETDIFAAHDGDGMIITYTDACSVQQLSTWLKEAHSRGLDMKEQYWDTDAERHVLAFGDVEDEQE